MVTSPRISQPYNGTDTDTDTDVPTAGTGVHVSYLATYALTLPEGDRPAVRDSLPLADRFAFDQALAVQSMRSDAPEAEATRRRKLRFEDELEKLQARDDAQAAHKQAKLDALSGADTEAAGAFLARSLDTYTLDTIAVPDPLIENYLDLNCTARVYGPSGSKKSFVMLDMAACVATGTEWHGNATTRRNVLYVVAEGSTGIMKRARAWEREYGKRMDGVTFHPEAVQIAEPAEMRGLIAAAKQIGAGMVIFDTQARSTVGIDENSNTDMGRVVAALDVLRRETGAAVVLVHHSGNEGGRARGATAVLGAMDAEFEVSCPGRSNRVGFKTTKRKDGEEKPPMTFRMVRHDVETTRGAEESLSVAVYASVGDVTEGGPEDVVTVRQVTPRQAEVLEEVARWDSASTRDVTGEVDMKRSTVAEHLTNLKRLEVIESVGSPATPKYRITEIGWTTLTRLGLTTGYHQVADRDSDA